MATPLKSNTSSSSNSRQNPQQLPGEGSTPSNSTKSSPASSILRRHRPLLVHVSQSSEILQEQHHLQKKSKQEKSREQQKLQFEHRPFPIQRGLPLTSSTVTSLQSQHPSQQAPRLSSALASLNSATNNSSDHSNHRESSCGGGSPESNCENQPVVILSNDTKVTTSKMTMKAKGGKHYTSPCDINDGIYNGAGEEIVLLLDEVKIVDDSETELSKLTVKPMTAHKSDNSAPTPANSSAGASTTTSFKRWTSIALSNVVNNANISAMMTIAALPTTAAPKGSCSVTNAKNSKAEEPVKAIFTTAKTQSSLHEENSNSSNHKRKQNSGSTSLRLGRSAYRFSEGLMEKVASSSTTLSAASSGTAEAKKLQPQQELALEGDTQNTNTIKSKSDAQELSVVTSDIETKNVTTVKGSSPTSVPSSIRLRYGRSAVLTAKKRSSPTAKLSNKSANSPPSKPIEAAVQSKNTTGSCEVKPFPTNEKNIPELQRAADVLKRATEKEKDSLPINSKTYADQNDGTPGQNMENYSRTLLLGGASSHEIVDTIVDGRESIEVASMTRFTEVDKGAKDAVIPNDKIPSNGIKGVAKKDDVILVPWPSVGHDTDNDNVSVHSMTKRSDRSVGDNARKQIYSQKSLPETVEQAPALHSVSNAKKFIYSSNDKKKIDQSMSSSSLHSFSSTCTSSSSLSSLGHQNRQGKRNGMVQNESKDTICFGKNDLGVKKWSASKAECTNLSMSADCINMSSITEQNDDVQQAVPTEVATPRVSNQIHQKNGTADVSAEVRKSWRSSKANDDNRDDQDKVTVKVSKGQEYQEKILTSANEISISGHGCILQSWREKESSKTAKARGSDLEAIPTHSNTRIADRKNESISKAVEHASPVIAPNSKNYLQLIPGNQVQSTCRTHGISNSWVNRNQSQDVNSAPQKRMQTGTVQNTKGERISNQQEQAPKDLSHVASRNPMEKRSVAEGHDDRASVTEVVSEADSVSAMSIHSSSILSCRSQSKIKREHSSSYTSIHQHQSHPMAWKVVANSSTKPNNTTAQVESIKDLRCDNEDARNIRHNVPHLEKYTGIIASEVENASADLKQPVKNWRKMASDEATSNEASANVVAAWRSKLKSPDSRSFDDTIKSKNDDLPYPEENSSVTSSGAISAHTSVLESWRNKILNVEKQRADESLSKGKNMLGKQETNSSDRTYFSLKQSNLRSPEISPGNITVLETYEKSTFGTSNSVPSSRLSWKVASKQALQAEPVSSNVSMNGNKQQELSNNVRSSRSDGTKKDFSIPPSQVNLRPFGQRQDGDDDSTLSETLTQDDGTEARNEISNDIVECGVSVASRKSMLLQKLKGSSLCGEPTVALNLSKASTGAASVTSPPSINLSVNGGRFQCKTGTPSVLERYKRIDAVVDSSSVSTKYAGVEANKQVSTEQIRRGYEYKPADITCKPEEIRLIKSEYHDLRDANSYGTSSSGSYTSIGSMAPIEQVLSEVTAQSLSEYCNGPSQFKKTAIPFTASTPSVEAATTSFNNSRTGTSTPIRSNKFKPDEKYAKNDQYSAKGFQKSASGDRDADKVQQSGKGESNKTLSSEPILKVTSRSGVSAMKAQLWGIKPDDGGRALSVTPIQQVRYGVLDPREKQITLLENDQSKVCTDISLRNQTVPDENSRLSSRSSHVSPESEAIRNKSSVLYMSSRPDISTPDARNPPQRYESVNTTRSSAVCEDVKEGINNETPIIVRSNSVDDAPSRFIHPRGNDEAPIFLNTSEVQEIDGIISDIPNVEEVEHCIEGASEQLKKSEAHQSVLHQLISTKNENTLSLKPPTTSRSNQPVPFDSMGCGTADLAIDLKRMNVKTSDNDHERFENAGKTYAIVRSVSMGEFQETVPSGQCLRRPSIGNENWNGTKSINLKELAQNTDSASYQILQPADANLTKGNKDKRRIYDLLDLDVFSGSISAAKIEKSDQNNANVETPTGSPSSNRKQLRPWIKDQHTLSPETWQKRRVFDLNPSEEANFFVTEGMPMPKTSYLQRSPSLMRMAADSIHAVDYEDALKSAPNQSISSDEHESRESGILSTGLKRTIPADLPAEFANALKRSDELPLLEINESIVSDAVSVVFGDPAAFGAAGGDDVNAPPPKVAARAKAIEKWNGGLGVALQKHDKQDSIRKEIGCSLSPIRRSNSIREVNPEEINASFGEYVVKSKAPNHSKVNDATSQGFWIGEENKSHWDQQDPHYGIANDYEVFELSVAAIPISSMAMRENAIEFQSFADDGWDKNNVITFPTLPTKLDTRKQEDTFNPFLSADDDDAPQAPDIIKPHHINFSDVGEVDINACPFNNQIHENSYPADDTKVAPVTDKNLWYAKQVGKSQVGEPDSFDPFATDDVQVCVKQEECRQIPNDPFAVTDPFSMDAIASLTVTTFKPAPKHNSGYAFDPFSDEAFATSEDNYLFNSCPDPFDVTNAPLFDNETIQNHPFQKASGLSETDLYDERSHRSRTLKSGYDADLSNLHDSLTNAEI